MKFRKKPVEIEAMQLVGSTADTFAVVDLDDPYFDGQTLPEALAPYPDHVHSTKGVCVKAPGGRFCGTPDIFEATYEELA